MIYLLVPCYNEAERIRLDEFSRFATPEMHIVFADDGSTDGTASLIETFLAKNSNPHLSLYKGPVNLGKAEIIRQAYRDLRQRQNFDAQDWIGYWDADLATPLSEVANMLIFSQSLYAGQVDSIWASRIYRLGSQIVRSPLRHYLGRLFATVISILLRVKSYDSQCGAKIFKAPAAEVAFAEAFISPWIFDVEILLRLHDFTVIEFPCLQWADIPGSKVKVFKEVGRVFLDILRIRHRYLHCVAEPKLLD